ncbi:hypothetical protein [Dyella sp.]|uniref:hypothetical protein n=1 Tax=Dyella sp. TaxID=1869338 RepID=UPI002ED00A3C
MRPIRLAPVPFAVGSLWLVVLAFLPWWLGLPLLLALTLALLLLGPRHQDWAAWCRRGLRWGLPGWLFALQRALGGDAMAWGVALLGALVGFSLIVLMESLQRHAKPASRAFVQPEWRELAMAPIGPPVRMVELQPVEWRDACKSMADPDGASMDFAADHDEVGSYRFASGRRLDGLSRRHGFSPGGRWFVASTPGGHGDTLWDRQADKVHRLRGWDLCGWYDEQPWLTRGTDGIPASLHEVLGDLSWQM